MFSDMVRHTILTPASLPICLLTSQVTKPGFLLASRQAPFWTLGTSGLKSMAFLFLLIINYQGDFFDFGAAALALNIDVHSWTCVCSLYCARCIGQVRCPRAELDPGSHLGLWEGGEGKPVFLRILPSYTYTSFNTALCGADRWQPSWSPKPLHAFHSYTVQRTHTFLLCLLTRGH